VRTAGVYSDRTPFNEGGAGAATCFLGLGLAGAEFRKFRISAKKALQGNVIFLPVKRHTDSSPRRQQDAHQSGSVHSISC
jgi:hypothetical protein